MATFSTFSGSTAPAYNSATQPLLDSDNLIWIVAVALSLASHAFLLFHKNNQQNAVPAMVTQETITHVRFASVSPPPVTVIEPEIKTPEPEPVLIQPEVKEIIKEIKKPLKNL